MKWINLQNGFIGRYVPLKSCSQLWHNKFIKSFWKSIFIYIMHLNTLPFCSLIANCNVTKTKRPNFYFCKLLLFFNTNCSLFLWQILQNLILSIIMLILHNTKHLSLGILAHRMLSSFNSLSGGCWRKLKLKSWSGTIKIYHEWDIGRTIRPIKSSGS